MSKGFPETRVSLIRSIQEGEQVAKEKFVELYLPHIHNFIVKIGVRGQDEVEDLAQTVMTKMLERLAKGFRYDETGSFRGYIAVVARRAWIDACRKNKKLPKQMQESEEPFQETITNIYDNDLVKRAFETLEDEETKRNWEIFKAVSLQEKSADETAKRYQISKTNVYSICFRLKRKLKNIYEMLDRNE